MQIGPIAQNPLEWLALKTNQAPIPLIHTQLFFVFSKAILSAFSLGVFESFRHKPLSINDAARAAGLNKKALEPLLHLLVSAGYLRYRQEKYSLSRMARKWCLKGSPDSVYEQQIFNNLCWHWMDHMETFLRTGNAIRYHDSLTGPEWRSYMEGMENFARTFAGRAVTLAPVLHSPRKLLDIGGGHGIFSAMFCKRYPSLAATIFDLPQAVHAGQQVLNKYAPENRITFQAGDALKDSFGEGLYDVALLSNVIHHFSKEEVVAVMVKAKQAMKGNGYLIVHEFLRSEKHAAKDVVGATLNLFFDLSSASGCWTEKQIISMARDASLDPVRTRYFSGAHRYAQLVFRKED